jgi:hypothetical protein
MKAYGVALSFCLVVVATCAAADEPERASGLSVHMLPERVAQIDGHSGGFTVASQTYSDATQLVAYFRTLPAATQKNGIWVVTTSPSAYSPGEREKLRSLAAQCQQQKIPVFTCRGSELPGGWKRGELPSGWNESSDAH